MKLNDHFSRWSVQSSSHLGPVHTDYHFLGWDDLVRRHWPVNAAPLLARCFPMYWDYLRSGRIFHVRQISHTALFTGLFPLGYLALFCLGLGTLYVGTLTGVGGALGSAAAGHAASLALCGSLWRPALKQSNRLGIPWLLRTFGFIHRWSLGEVPELEERVQSMAAHIVECQRKDPAQETLLIGHSVGSLLAVCVASKLLEMLETSKPSVSLENVHLLTLGQCIPLMSLLPHADSFRAQLHALGNQTRLPWTDVSAKADPLCFFHSSPLPASASLKLTLKTARFFQMFSPQTYRRMRWDKIRLHFQYLMSSETPSAYDFFNITASPHRFETFIEGKE